MESSMALDDIPKDGWKAANGFPVPDFVEPVLTVAVLLLAMFLTRRKDYSMLRSRSRYEPLPDEELPSPRISDEYGELLSRRRDGQHPPKYRSFGPCLRFTTPNSSRFAQNFHSRILQKFPFLIEMFYWGVSFGAYRYTKVLAQAIYGGQKGMWDSAQEHGLSILNMEALLWGGHQPAPQRWLEWRIQRWFLHGNEAGDCRAWILSFLNRGYALVHLPGTVAFLAYLYTTASTHARFCTVRRTMTLTNFLAFIIFILMPTMPPRLLPKEYGFVDSVSLEDAESVWMGGDFVNLLAAMPSMHFGYAFCIGCTFIAESGVVRGLFSWIETLAIRPAKCDGIDDDDDDDEDDDGYGQPADPRHSALTRACMFVFGIWYPTWMLITIISTANHYFLDALAAVFVVLAGYMMNRVLCVFLPIEDYMLWILRLEKPVPTTGWKKNLTVDK